jgi:hypothetical protein
MPFQRPAADTRYGDHARELRVAEQPGVPCQGCEVGTGRVYRRVRNDRTYADERDHVTGGAPKEVRDGIDRHNQDICAAVYVLVKPPRRPAGRKFRWPGEP